MKRVIKWSWGIVKFGIIFLFISFCGSAWAQAQQAATDPAIVGWAFLSASLATGLSAIAAGIAVAHVGAAAVGAISEKPEMAGKALIYVGLAEGIAIYGLIIAIMILGKI
ncbi:MAG: ATP synthase subunit C [Candidatus Omnitrophota bacterium]